MQGVQCPRAHRYGGPEKLCVSLFESLHTGPLQPRYGTVFLYIQLEDLYDECIKMTRLYISHRALAAHCKA